jgi:nitrate/nitrite transporter NarK
MRQIFSDIGAIRAQAVQTVQKGQVYHVSQASKRTILVAAVGSAATLAAVGIAGASVAYQPQTNECATGIYAGYCGTQVDSGSPPLSIAVSRSGDVIATSSPADGSANWFWFLFEGQTYDIAEFAPNGVASNEVMAQVASRIVLQRADGDKNQQWLFTCYSGCTSGPYVGTWTNYATGEIISATTNGGPVVPVTLSGAPTSAETWVFQTP